MFMDRRTDRQMMDEHQSHRYFLRTFRSGDKNAFFQLFHSKANGTKFYLALK